MARYDASRHSTFTYPNAPLPFPPARNHPLITSELRLASVVSTMDAARELATTQDYLLVSAETQSGGKGTRGRAWRSPPGNIYMTVGIHRRRLPAPRLALLPLELGLHLWEESASRVTEEARSGLKLKWPNDLLYQGRKTAGILVESFGDYLMAGFGINVAAAPEVTDGGAPAACLAEAGIPPGSREALVEGIYQRIRAAESDPESILLAWQAKVDWDRPVRLRDREGSPKVTAVSVNRHGHLLVRHGNGTEEWLVSEYLL